MDDGYDVDDGDGDDDDNDDDGDGVRQQVMSSWVVVLVHLTPFSPPELPPNHSAGNDHRHLLGD